MKTILVVDDDKLSRLMVREMIEEMTSEFKVIIFSSGEELLEELDRIEPDAIVCDIEMPGISGLDVCREIKKEKNRFIPIILITGRRLSRAEIIEGYKAGCDDYIVKPFDSDELYARLRPVLTIKHLQDKILNENKNLEEVVKERTVQLSISNDNYLAMFHSTTAGIAPVDETGTILDCNESLMEILDLSYGEIIGNKFCDLFSSVDIEWLRNEGISNLSKDAIIYKALLKDDRSRYISLVIKLFTYDNKTSYLYIINDITFNIDAFNNLKNMTLNLVTILTQTIEAKDSYTKGHCLRVAGLSIKMGDIMGLSKIQIRNLRLGSLFHDIGKIGINEDILNKKGKLTDDEFKQIQQHTTIGENILKNVDFFKPILPMIRGHHEKFNGTGYPDNKTGDSISIEERIIAVADVFDALTSNRSYRDPLTTEDAIKELKKSRDIHLDPEIVDLFIAHKVYELPKDFNIFYEFED